jgi:RHH-type rel operon transcriptional repressor/antitoxin RelB
MQGAHPAERAGLSRALSPAHRLRPGKIANDAGQDFGQHLRGRAAGALDDRDVELALLWIVLDLRLVNGGEADALQKTFERLVGRADAGTAPLLAHVLALGGQPGHVQRQPPRRREGLGALIEKAALDERVGDELAQILRRAPLHARGDFFGQEFEQKIWHEGMDCASGCRLVERPDGRVQNGASIGAWLPDWTFCYTCIARDTPMLALRLPDDIEKRLEALARKTGRTKSFYAREAILRHLEDIEDAHLARERLKRRRGRVGLEELEGELDTRRGK